MIDIPDVYARGQRAREAMNCPEVAQLSQDERVISCSNHVLPFALGSLILLSLPLGS